MTTHSIVPGKDAIIKLIVAFHPDARIYLFGSYARGKQRESSDVDVAVDIGRRLDFRERSFLSNLFEALPIAQRVDLVDMQAIPDELRDVIVSEGIIWKF